MSSNLQNGDLLTRWYLIYCVSLPLNEKQDLKTFKHLKLFLFFFRPVWNYPLIFETLDCNGKPQVRNNNVLNKYFIFFYKVL